jgi:SAM-dependent methyltransferase
VLDVRPRHLFESDGHVPGAALLPPEALASAPAVVPEDARAVLVVGGAGSRALQAAELLAEAGFAGVAHLPGGMARWTGPVERSAVRPAGPSPWLLANARLAPAGARVLDVACGRGRHALFLASAGSQVRAVDRDPARIETLARVARRLRLPIDAEALDLEAGEADLGAEQYELILVFNYLHRPLFPALARALRPGGVLLCETFTREHRGPHGPTRPEHLLEPGELERLVAPLEVVRRREGERDGLQLASVAARRRASYRVAESQDSATASIAAAPATHAAPEAVGGAAPGEAGSSTPGARKR